MATCLSTVVLALGFLWLTQWVLRSGCGPTGLRDDPHGSGGQRLLEAASSCRAFGGGKGPRDAWACWKVSLPFSMSVPQAMEWLIEHADDPTIDTPLPGHTSPGPAGAEAPAEAAAGPSEEAEEAKDELTEIFKKIRRKRAFRADGRVRALLGRPAAAPLGGIAWATH